MKKIIILLLISSYCNAQLPGMEVTKQRLSNSEKDWQHKWLIADGQTAKENSKIFTQWAYGATVSYVNLVKINRVFAELNSLNDLEKDNDESIYPEKFGESTYSEQDLYYDLLLEKAEISKHFKCFYDGFEYRVSLTYNKNVLLISVIKLLK